MKKFYLFISICIVLMLLLIAPADASNITLSTDIGSIDIDMTFNGCEVQVNGLAPQGSDIYIKFTSPKNAVNLSKMGKKSVLWIPTENTVVEDIPGMFQVLTSAPISGLGDELQAVIGIDVGYTHVLSTARVLQAGEGGEKLTGARAGEYLGGLISLLEERGLFGINEGGISREGDSYRATFIVPPDIPNGISTIEAFAVKEGEIVASAKRTIAVNPVGVVQTISYMATETPFIYGMLAVGIALFAGFLITMASKAIGGLV